MKNQSNHNSQALASNKKVQRTETNTLTYIKQRIREEEADARRIAAYGIDPRISWVVLEELRKIEQMLETEQTQSK